MKFARTPPAVGVGVAIGVLLVGVAFSAAGERKSWNFDTGTPGGLPAGFTQEVGEWKIAADETAPSKGQVLAQAAKSSGPTFNLALVKESDYQDLELSVKMKAISGEVDQGGGLVWRAKDKGNYYIVRYNPLEDNFRVYKVVDGRRTQLGSADSDSLPGWHEIRVTMNGDHIECYFDGKKALDVKDATLKGSGKIGLWTKADAQTHFDDLAASRLGASASGETREDAPKRLVSARVEAGPVVNGKGDDSVWSKASPAKVATRRIFRPGSPEGAAATSGAVVQIRSVHTDKEVYFLVEWDDPTDDSASHKTWVWNKEKKAYEEGSDRDDTCALAFEHAGVFDADMLAGAEGVWDVWHWKSYRTNPQGYAMDKTHHFSLEKPSGKANSYRARNGKTVWIARPEDKGETVEKKQAAPSEFQGDRVAQNLPGKPSGSAADVGAKGVWSDGRWTLELSRALNTSNSDDTAFDVSRAYKMALTVLDRTADFPHNASEVIELTFTR
ncbi:MAG: DUF1080 domain-containing protein [Planctomycetes bacterium]|nr:DUF1080 domain-containing protein [Planctomycetota bacterium]